MFKSRLQQVWEVGERERGDIWSSRFFFFLSPLPPPLSPTSLLCAIKFNDTSACLNRLKWLRFFFLFALAKWSERGPRSKAPTTSRFLPALHNLMTANDIRSVIHSFQEVSNTSDIWSSDIDVSECFSSVFFSMCPSFAQNQMLLIELGTGYFWLLSPTHGFKICRKKKPTMAFPHMGEEVGGGVTVTSVYLPDWTKMFWETVFHERAEALVGPHKSPLCSWCMSYLFMRDMPWLGNACQASRWGGHQWRQLNTSEALSQIFPLSPLPPYPSSPSPHHLPPSSLTDDNSVGVRGSWPDREGHHQLW